MKIIICDDDKEMIDKLRVSCEKMNIDKNDIHSFDSSKKLCDFLVEKKPTVDLFILDIEMPEINGLEIKKMISSLYIDTSIVFVTSHEEMMADAFGKKVLAFLLKESYEDKLSHCIRMVRDDIRKTDILKFFEAGKEKSIFLSQIVLIKAEHIYTIVEKAYCYNDDLEQFEVKEESFRISMKKWEEMITKDFFKINRSLIVNLQHVEKIRDGAVLDTGEVVAVSPKRIRALKVAFNQYCDRSARCVL